MQSSVAELEGLGFRTLCVGRIVRVNEEGQALVDFPTNQNGPKKARSVISPPPDYSNPTDDEVRVLLFFENGDPALPIIIGFIRDALFSPVSAAEPVFSKRPDNIVLDLRKILLETKEEIVLRCGKGSVTLKHDGKIV